MVGYCDPNGAQLLPVTRIRFPSNSFLGSSKYLAIDVDDDVDDALISFGGDTIDAVVVDIIGILYYHINGHTMDIIRINSYKPVNSPSIGMI
jgi:hypothetical protein